MTCVIALDIAMHRTGAAILGPDWERPVFSTFETANWSTRQGYNLLNLEKFLDTKRNLFGITHMVYEKVFVNVLNGGAAFQWNGTEAQLMMAGVAVKWAEAHKIQQNTAEIDDWRKHFLAHCRKPKWAKANEKYWKDLAMKRAQILDWQVTYHDEAEAGGIADYTLFCIDANYRTKTGPRVRRNELDYDHRRGIFSL